MASVQEAFFNDVVAKKLQEDLGKTEGAPEVLDAVKRAFDGEVEKERGANIEGFLKDLNGDLLRLGFSSGLLVFIRIWYRITFSDVKPLGSEIRASIPADLLDRVKKRANGIILMDAIEKHGLRPVERKAS